MTLLAITLALVLGPSAGPPRAHADVQAPARLHCRIDVTPGASGRCEVNLPAGRQVRRCTDGDRLAGHCDPGAGGGRYVAWVVSSGAGRCRISKKKTDWTKDVEAKVGKSDGGGSACDLYVELQ